MNNLLRVKDSHIWEPDKRDSLGEQKTKKEIANNLAGSYTFDILIWFISWIMVIFGVSILVYNLEQTGALSASWGILIELAGLFIPFIVGFRVREIALYKRLASLSLEEIFEHYPGDCHF